MVVNDAISAGILGVTTIDRPPHVEPDSAKTDGVDEAGVLGAALERQAPMLLAAARALLRNEADARDLVQTTLEIASRKASDLRDPSALRAWLLAIQLREAFRLRRRIARLVRISPEIVEISPSPGPDADVIALHTALAKLPTRARAAVVLHYFADLSVADVARAMGISENTTKGHLKAGLAHLREELRDD
jgi:RNA polymerase sigma-70 factor (ECF subfamily)